jgi:hypothetical protein
MEEVREVVEVRKEVKMEKIKELEKDVVVDVLLEMVF